MVLIFVLLLVAGDIDDAESRQREKDALDREEDEEDIS